MKLRKKIFAVKISYLVSILLMLLLKTPLGVETNGMHFLLATIIPLLSFPLPDVWNDLIGYHTYDWEIIRYYKVSEEEYEKVDEEREYRVINISTMDTVVHYDRN